MTDGQETSNTPGSKNTWVILSVLALIVVGIGAFLFSSKNKVQPSLGKTASPLPAGSTVVLTPAREIVVEGKEFAFVPAKITATKGERIKVTLKNTGRMQHDFVIDELGVSTKLIPPGVEDSVEFTVQDAGVYTYYCSVGNHRAQGMVGTLEVK
jgi:plastocyanin